MRFSPNVQVHHPTGVTHCAAAYLTSPIPENLLSGRNSKRLDDVSIPNLVVVKSTVLEVYTVSEHAAKGSKLRLLTRQRLFGVVESLAVLNGNASDPSAAAHDALLLTFRDAKLSVLQWNASTCDLVPSSLHFFEGDESLKSGRKVFPRPPLVVTDPAGRCAAVVMFRHQLAILPAIESETAALGVVGADEANLYGGDGGGKNKETRNNDAVSKHNNLLHGGESETVATVGNSYVDNLSKLGIRDVRDAVFLHNAAEPTLLLLHELNPTWSGSLRTQKDTIAVTALSLNLDAKRHPKIWSVHGLPYDAAKLVSVPGVGVGGALVFTGNGVLYVSPTHKTGVVLNSAAVPSPLPPPPMVFDLSKETPGQTGARYARENDPRALHPDAASATLSFCDTSHAEWNLECCDAQVVWLDGSKALVALKTSAASEFATTGILCIINVTKGGGGHIQLNVVKTGVTGPLLSCITGLGYSSMVFLGSKKGNSLLTMIDYEDRTADLDGDERDEHREAKRPKLVGAIESASHKNILQEPDDAVLLYGEGVYVDDAGPTDKVEDNPDASSKSTTKLKINILHSMDCMAPLRCLVQAPAVSGVAGDRGPIASSSQPPCLIACCGTGNLGGSLFVLHQSVLPDIITTFNLNGVNGAWAVGHKNPAAKPETERFHAYLLLSLPSETKVLSAGNDLKEVTEEVEFAGDTTTIAAGSLDDGRVVVQAFPQGLRSIETVSGEMKHEVWAGQIALGTAVPKLETRTFVTVYIDDPYVVARTNDGFVLAFVIRPGSGMLTLVQDPVAASVTCCSLFNDTGGWFSSDDLSSRRAFHYCVVAFGDGRCQFWRLPQFENETQLDLSVKLTWQCAGLVEGASLLTPLVSDGGQTAKRGENYYPSIDGATADGASGRSVIEVAVHAFSSGNDGLCRIGDTSLILVALTSDDCLLVYKAFWYGGRSVHHEQPSPMGSTRFKRIRVDAPPCLRLPQSNTLMPNTRLARFDTVVSNRSCSGIFVAGEVPLWLVVSGDGSVWCHPCALPSTNSTTQVAKSTIVTSFTPFHNVNCPHGFVLTQTTVSVALPTPENAERSSSSSILVAGLPARLRLDSQWPQQKLALKATPIRACYYPEARLIVVATARTAGYKEFLPEEEQGMGGEPHATYSYALADATAKVRGSLLRHQVQLLEPSTRTMLSSCSLLPGESVLALEALHLRDSTTGSTVPVVVVGVGFAAGGEDYPCSGRVLVFEVVRCASIDPPSGHVSSSKAVLWRLALLYSREFKGPVTAVSAVDGLLLLATGNRLETCILTSKTRTIAGDSGAAEDAEMALPETQTTYTLQRSAFYEGPSLVTSLSVVKSFALLGDIDNSVQFVRYKEDGKQLVLLGKDFGSGLVRAAELFIAGSSLFILAADGGGSLRCFTYAPGDASSWKGQKLKNWGVLHVGHGIGCMERLRCPAAPAAPNAAKPTLMYGVMYGTDEGGFGLLIPLLPLNLPLDGSASNDPSNHQPPSTLTMLVQLSKELVHAVAHPAGLNPGAFRRRYHKTPPSMGGGRPYGPALPLSGQGILDVDLLMEFAMLPVTMQARLAAKVGRDRFHILQALSYLCRGSWLS